ncbi:MAG: glycosyltransferase [Candidatus Omnitrophota bacterium]|nr:glycosyltransferase [Candidatus Omnitrophota bacterium]MDZ4241383.1 glycosyltransferase [Candidatus Omnitrophota bacterium]
MVRPDVTVLMTVYNGGRYLAPAVQSVLSQTFGDFEFLIVDDCSTDGSAAVIESFKDSRIFLHRNPENLGQTKSLNAGLKLAKGPYIARIDADDWAFPRWLEIQHRFIVSHPQYVAVSAQAVIINSENRIVRKLASSSEPADMVLKLFASVPINHGGVLMKKNRVLECGGYDEKYRVVADYDLWSRLVGRGHQLTSTADVLMAIRFHEASVSVTDRRTHVSEEMAEVVRRNFELLSGIAIGREDALLVEKIYYDGGSAEIGEFRRGLGLLERAYGAVKKSFQVPRPAARRKFKALLRALCVKKIFAPGQSAEGVRQTARCYVERYGLLNIPFALLVVSYFGVFGVRALSACHRLAGKFLMRLRLRKGSLVY